METTREANRSYFTISESELQKIVNEKYGTGFLKSTTPIKEVIVLDKTVGVVYNNLGEYMGETNRLTIHYSKRKTHAVPSKRREYGKTKLA